MGASDDPAANSKLEGLLGAAKRFGLQLFGTKGMLTMTTGALPEIWFVEDPSWQPGQSRAQWKRLARVISELGRTHSLCDDDITILLLEP